MVDLTTLEAEILDDFHGLHDYVTTMEATLRHEYEEYVKSHKEMTTNLPDRWYDDLEEDPIEYLYFRRQ